MKRLFILLSNILLCLFLIWVFTIRSDTYVTHFYPNVSVFDASSEATFDCVSENLTTLAKKTNSLIAMQHQDPGPDGVPIFSYTTFGQGTLPEGLSEKTLEDAKNSSLETNYFIFKGKLDVTLLRQELSNVGMTRLYITTPSQLTVLASMFRNGFQVTSLLIFLLTFGALSLISQIKMLRTAGIRLISGEGRWKIFLRPLVHDFVHVLLSLIISIVLAILLKTYVSFPCVAFYTIGTGLVVYNLLLLLISLFFACIFVVGIKKVHLMQVIKGQIPVRGIISLVLLGQLLAVVIVSIGLRHTLLYSQAWQQQKQGQMIWYKEKELIALSASRGGVTPGFDTEAIEKQQSWFKVMEQAVSEQNGILSRHYLAEKALQQGAAISKGSSSLSQGDYVPQGNVLIVTPQYLQRQNIAVEPEVAEKIKRLATGEFVLLLPETLRSEEKHYQSVFEEELGNLMSSREMRQKMIATVSYLKTEQERFVYNITPISYQQFLRDPIIMVLTPYSTGPQSFSFWMEALQSYFFFAHLEDAQKLIEAHGIKNWVGELQSGYNLYQKLLSNIQREIWTTLAGAILGILTAILMFNTMNRLYFEEFRRDIFIKRIAGLRFLEIHRTYLLAQLFVFLLGCLASLLFTANLVLSFLVLFLFIGISLLQLHIQLKKEDKMSMLILKGA